MIALLVRRALVIDIVKSAGPSGAGPVMTEPMLRMRETMRGCLWRGEGDRNRRHHEGRHSKRGEESRGAEANPSPQRKQHGPNDSHIYSGVTLGRCPHHRKFERTCERIEDLTVVLLHHIAVFVRFCVLPPPKLP